MWFVLILICCCFILFDAWYYIRFGVTCFICLLSKKKSLFEESVMYGKIFYTNGRQLKSVRVFFISRVLWILTALLTVCTILWSWIFAFHLDFPQTCRIEYSLIWNRHGHECSRIWKLSGNFTLIQSIKKCRDILGRDILGTTFF
jgi:hypothetical protein